MNENEKMVHPNDCFEIVSHSSIVPFILYRPQITPEKKNSHRGMLHRREFHFKISFSPLSVPSLIDSDEILMTPTLITQNRDSPRLPRLLDSFSEVELDEKEYSFIPMKQKVPPLCQHLDNVTAPRKKRRKLSEHKPFLKMRPENAGSKLPPVISMPTL